MSDTFDSTFSTFFTDHDESVCVECGGNEDLQTVYVSNEKPVRKCRRCRSAFQAELNAEAARQREAVREMAWRAEFGE